MPPRKAVPWSKWSIYYVGRGLELAGLVLVTWSIFLFFGSSQMRPMLAMTGAGGAMFFAGWLLALKDPRRK
ncbi:MAG: hypothetical protein ACRD21_16255 [Vicinamibacteria bacterium]